MSLSNFLRLKGYCLKKIQLNQLIRDVILHGHNTMDRSKMAGSGKRVSNLFVVLPQVIIDIFNVAKKNDGYLDEDSIDEIKQFHTRLPTFDDKLQRQYFSFALLQYRQHIRTTYADTYEDLCKDLISNLNFSEEVIDEMFRHDSIEAQKIREQKEENALQQFIDARNCGRT